MRAPPPIPRRLGRHRRLRRLLLTVLGLVVVPTAEPAAGGVVEVTDADSLRQTVAHLGDEGGIVLLRPGEYGDVTLRALHPDQPLQLLGVADDASARFHSLTIENASNIVLSGLTIARALEPGEPASLATAGLRVHEVNDIEIAGLTFTGSVDGDLGNDGVGASIRGSRDVAFTGNTCHDLMRCAVFSQTEGLVVRGNTARNIRSDGLDFAGVRDAVIAGNLLTAFPIQYGDPRKGGDHKDFIQFWTRATHPSEDVVIRDNLLVEIGTETQAIFIRSETGEPHRNFVIENNIIYASSYHGITVGGVHGALVKDNTIIAEPNQRLVSGLNIHGSRDVRLVDNLVARLSVEESSGVEEVGTRRLQWLNGKAPGYYGSTFANAFTVRDLEDLRPLPGGLALEVGATRLFEQLSVNGRISVSTVGGPHSLSRRFAADCTDCGRPGEPWRWRFGDGRSAEGAEVEHTFAAPGRYVVEARRGSGPALRRAVEVRTPLILDLRFDGDLADCSGRDYAIGWDGPARYIDAPGGSAAHFRRRDKAAVTVTPGSQFSGQSALTVAFDLRTDAPGDARLVWLHESFGLEIGRGALILHLFDSAGRQVRLMAPLPTVPRQQWRHILFTFDGATGQAQLTVDRRIVDSLRGLAPALASVSGRALTIGGIHGRHLSGAIDNLRIADAVMTADEIHALSSRLCNSAQVVSQ